MAVDYRQYAQQMAQQASVDMGIFVAQIQQESGFNPNAQSSAGAIGIAQFMPATAAGIGLNPWDPLASLKAAAQLDRQNLTKYQGDWAKTLAAYNAGGGAVDSAVSRYGSNWLSHMPSETQNYVSTILGNSSSNNQSSTGDSSLGAITGGQASGTGNASNFPASCAPWDIRCSLASFASSNSARQVGLLFIGLVFLLLGIEIIFFGGRKNG
jgi:Transglycosylase SLT domain